MGIAGAAAGAAKSLEEILAAQMFKAKLAEQQQRDAARLEMDQQRMGMERERLDHALSQAKTQQREGHAAGIVGAMDDQFDPASENMDPEISDDVMEQLQGTTQAHRVREIPTLSARPIDPSMASTMSQDPGVGVRRLTPTGQQQGQRRTEQAFDEMEGNQELPAPVRRMVGLRRRGVPVSASDVETEDEQATKRETVRRERMDDFREQEGIRAAHRPALDVDPQPVVNAPTDPDSQDIMSQTGLSYNGFLAATGRMSQLSRDRATRNRASAEVAAWARSRGMDVATLGSQYKAYNDTLASNIERYNRTVLAEGEIKADVENLLGSVKKSNLGDARAINAAKQWLQGELNDPNAAEYGFYLNQLTNDIALYNAASQGRAALEADLRDAKSVVQRGVATGSLTGLQEAITQSVEKMGVVLEGAVNRSRKNVWDLFGVGDKYQPTNTRQRQPANPSSGGDPLGLRPGGGQ